MPVTVPILYELYVRQIEEGTLDLDGVRCPLCRGLELALTQTRVRRGMVQRTSEPGRRPVLERIKATIALASCRRCRGRVRVLPADVLARKIFALPVVEACCADYLEDGSLRRTVSSMGANAPAASTLHGWSAGLGAHVLMRPGADIDPDARFAPLLANTTQRERRVHAVDDIPEPNPQRHRGEIRREQLGALNRLLAIAMLVTCIPTPGTLTAWRQVAHRWSVTSTLSFRSAFPSTRIEHAQAGAPVSAKRARETPPFAKANRSRRRPNRQPNPG